MWSTKIIYWTYRRQKKYMCLYSVNTYYILHMYLEKKKIYILSKYQVAIKKKQKEILLSIVDNYCYIGSSYFFLRKTIYLLLTSLRIITQSFVCKVSSAGLLAHDFLNNWSISSFFSLKNPGLSSLLLLIFARHFAGLPLLLLLPSLLHNSFFVIVVPIHFTL